MPTQPSLSRRAVLLFSLLLFVLQASSCVEVAPASKSVLPTTSNPILPRSLSGEKTASCDHVLKVLQALQDYSNGRRTQGVSFEFTEAEINEYLAYSLRIKPRAGVKDLSVRFFQGNQVSAFARIDFSGVEKWNGWLIPGALRPTLLSMEAPAQIDFKFQASDGFATFQLKNAIGPGNAVIPKNVMEWIIQAIALHQPEWLDTTEDISLPFRLQKIWTAEQSLSGRT